MSRLPSTSTHALKHTGAKSRQIPPHVPPKCRSVRLLSAQPADHIGPSKISSTAATPTPPHPGERSAPTPSAAPQQPLCCEQCFALASSSARGVYGVNVNTTLPRGLRKDLVN